jgi:hypothetical protein
VSLFNEAKRIIRLENWAVSYKEQILSRVIDYLEIGRMIRTLNAGHAIPFVITDVQKIVSLMSNLDN